jgi:transcriptional regulator with XRE-family HTH domain
MFDLNLPNSAVYEWKKGKARPGVDALIKIAEYFSASTDYLLLGKDAVSKEDDYTKTERRLIKDFRELNENGQEQVLEQMENILSRPKYKKGYSFSDTEFSEEIG